MNRREFVQAFVRSSAAFSAVAALPALADEATDFDAAAARQPLFAAMKGVSDANQDLHGDALRLSGRWPAELRGRLLRNGPALFERGGQRYHHWFDGDGMVQQFSIGERGIAHVGRWCARRSCWPSSAPAASSTTRSARQ